MNINNFTKEDSNKRKSLDLSDKVWNNGDEQFNFEGDKEMNTIISQNNSVNLNTETIIQTLEYVTVGLREGFISINDHDRTFLDYDENNEITVSNVDDSKNIAKTSDGNNALTKNIYNAEIVSVIVRTNEKTGNQFVYWNLKFLDKEAPDERISQITWIDCGDRNKYLKKNFSICGFPDAKIDDLKNQDFIKNIVGISVKVQLKKNNENYWNAQIIERIQDGNDR